MKVRLSRIKKRENSTLQPGGSWDWEDFDVILKDNCSVVAPSIFLKVSQSRNMAMFNYARIDDFERYYYIRDWEWIDRQWCARLEVDVLASWKAQIGQYTAYVTRSAAQYDGDIVDMLYPTQAEKIIRSTTPSEALNWASEVSDGWFVLGIMGKDAAQNGGAITYYAAKKNALKRLTEYMLDPANYGSIDDISQDLWKSIFNPLQYIVSCMWFPVEPSRDMTTPSVNFGWWSPTIAGITQLNYMRTTWRNVSFPIPKHPQSTTRGNYLNLNPYSEYFLYAPSWGIIPLDNRALLNKNNLNIDIQVDFITGSGRIRVKDGESIINEQFAQVGVPIQMGQNAMNQGALFQGINNAVTAASDALFGSFSSAISNTVSYIGNACALRQSVPSTKGSNGSFTYHNTFQLTGIFENLVSEDLASRGRPLCQPKQLSTLSGYVLCSDADPAIDCTHAELEKIVSYLNSGFYME